MEEQKKPEIPSPEEFFTKSALYAQYSFAQRKQILDVEFFRDTIDTYCVECNRESVFKSDADIPRYMSGSTGNQWIRPERADNLQDGGHLYVDERHELFWPRNLLNPPTPTVGEYFPSDRFFVVRFHCTRIKTHYLYYCCVVRNSAVMKIGQYPSLADVESAGLQKYRKVLTPAKYAELIRAVGLTTHGVGIGAFVYLRRIFEDLIEEARVAAAEAPSWDNPAFEAAPVDGKILLLKAHLPEFLVQNRKLYGILSVGIHELTEQECLRHFPLVRLGIELILDEKLRKKETDLKVRQAGKALTKLKEELDKK